MRSDFLHKDPRTEDAEMLLVVLKHQVAPTGGASLRQAALLHGLRQCATTDVACLHTIRQAADCTETCNACTTPCYCERSAALLARLVRQGNYQVVVMSHLFTSPYFEVVRENSAAALVLDQHNAQWHLKKEMLRHPDERLRVALGIQDDLATLSRMETSALAEADLVTVCSEADRQRLRDRYGCSTPMTVVPNAVRISEGSRPTKVELPEVAFFIGTMNYFPNTQAAVRIFAETGPAIRARSPGMRVAVAGRHMPSSFEPTGCVDLVRNPADVAPLFQRSILIVPLEMGGGSRLKILESFAAGCPVVSSTKGIEGIHAGADTHFLLADDVASTAIGVEQILADPEADLRRRQAAWDLANATYSWHAVAAAVAESLRLLAARTGV